MFRVLVIGGESSEQGRFDAITAAQLRLEEALGSAESAAVCSPVTYFWGQGDLFQTLLQLVQQPDLDSCKFDLLLLLAHGGPGEMFFSRARYAAPRASSPSVTCVPVLDGTPLSLQWMREIRCVLAENAEVYLLACDFAGSRGTPTGMAPGALVGAQLQLALNYGSNHIQRSVYFANGRLSPDRAANMAIHREELWSVRVDVNGGHSTIRVSRAEPRHVIPGLTAPLDSP